MFNASMIRDALHDSREYGFEGAAPEAKLNWPTLKAKRDAYVARLNGIYKSNLEKDSVTRLSGFGKFTGAKQVEVAGVTYTASHVVIATGGYPLMDEANIKGALTNTINSDGFFELEQQPKKVAVIGAGYIAVELCGIFNGLGSESHLFIRGEKALRKFDCMVVDVLDEEMRKTGISIHTQSVTQTNLIEGKQDDR
jgi:glutathione reductase (NADPH)